MIKLRIKRKHINFIFQNSKLKELLKIVKRDVKSFKITRIIIKE